MPYSQGYRYILRVVDHMSCFGYVAPVKFKEAEEIGTQVVKIISTSIAPQILQFDNGREVSISSFYCCQFECDVECQFKYTEWTISIVFHQTWRVPTLYFTCAQTDGTPLCRQQVLDVSLLQHENQNHNIKCRDIMEVYIPRGTSNDWVTLLFLHSCRTSERVDLKMEMFMIWYQNHSHSALVANHEDFSCSLACVFLYHTLHPTFVNNNMNVIQSQLHRTFFLHLNALTVDQCVLCGIDAIPSWDCIL